MPPEIGTFSLFTNFLCVKFSDLSINIFFFLKSDLVNKIKKLLILEKKYNYSQFY